MVLTAGGPVVMPMLLFFVLREFAVSKEAERVSSFGQGSLELD